MVTLVTDSGIQASEVSSSLPLQAECVTFTGRLASMNHRDAAALVETYGGRAVSSMSRAVTMVVIGEEGWPLEEDGQPAQKMLAAKEAIAEGADLRLVSESDWLHLIGLNEQRDEIQRSYTPAMLSRLLDVPVGMIRRWSRIGLIRPVRRVCRLPYFDFREVSNAQRLADLLQDGVKPEVLERSLGHLSDTLAGTDRSLAQLNLLIHDEKVMLRDSHGVMNPRTGQRLLDFGEAQLQIVHDDASTDFSTPQFSVPHLSMHDESSASANEFESSDTGSHVGSDDEPVSLSFEAAVIRRDDRSMNDFGASEWFHEGCWLAEEAEFSSAVNAFRNCLSRLALDQISTGYAVPATLAGAGQEPELFPDPADVNFHLADALYRSGSVEAAIERYHCAIEFAPDFIEAWTQLGCLLAEVKSWGPAEESLQAAIAIHPSNPDALLHYAQLLDETSRPDEAAAMWERYLQHDSRGPWADHARRRLGLAEQH